MTTQPLAPWQTALLTPAATTNEAWASIPERPRPRVEFGREITLLEDLANDFEEHPPADVPACLRRLAQSFRDQQGVGA